MPTNWRTAYEAAIREQDPAKIAAACEKARRAIVDAILELPAQAQQGSPQREELDQALRTLLSHEWWKQS